MSNLSCMLGCGDGGGVCASRFPSEALSREYGLESCCQTGACCHTVPEYNHIVSLEQACCCQSDANLVPAHMFGYFYDREQRSITNPQLMALENPELVSAPHKQSHWPQYQNMTNRQKPPTDFTRNFTFAPNYPSPIAVKMTRKNKCFTW